MNKITGMMGSNTHNTAGTHGSGAPELAELTPGQQLREAREDAGLQIEDIAQQLKLTQAQIVSLENDEYEKLPSEPFVLGYLRAYSRLLGLSPEAAVQGFHVYLQKLQKTMGQVTEPRGMKRAGEIVTGSSGLSRGKNRRYLYAVVVLLLIWVLAALLLEDKPVSSEVGETLSLETSGLPVESEAVESEVIESEVIESAMIGSKMGEWGSEVSPPVANAIIDVTNAAASAVNSGTVTPALDDGLDILYFQFADECWLEVIDANDDILISDIFQTGDDISLRGVAPFDVMMGNVRVVTVSLNGEGVSTSSKSFQKTLRTVIGLPR